MATSYKRTLSLKITTKAWGISAIEVYHGLKDVVGAGPRVLQGLVNVSKSVWNVTVVNESVKEKLLDEVLVVKGEVCNVEEIDSDRLLVKMKVPLEIPDERVITELIKYGKVDKVEHETYPFDRTLENGIRRIWFEKVEQPLPSKVTIDGRFILPLWYRGQIKECRICLSTEHLATDCPNKNKCLVCGSSDHFKWRCPQNKYVKKGADKSAEQVVSKENVIEPVAAEIVAEIHTNGKHVAKENVIEPVVAEIVAEVHVNEKHGEKTKNPIAVVAGDEIEVLDEGLSLAPVTSQSKFDDREANSTQVEDEDQYPLEESFNLGQVKFRSQDTETNFDFPLSTLNLDDLNNIEKVIGVSDRLSGTKRQKDGESSESEIEESDIEDDNMSVAESDISIQTQSSKSPDEMVMYRSEAGEVLVPYVTANGVKYRHLRHDSDILKYKHLEKVELSNAAFVSKIGKWSKRGSKKTKSS
jgi:hypothetical protein